MQARARRIPSFALYAALVGGFVFSGMHSRGNSPEHAPASVSKTAVETTYYVDATVGCDRARQPCITETRKRANGTVHVTVRSATTP